MHDQLNAIVVRD